MKALGLLGLLWLFKAFGYLYLGWPNLAANSKKGGEQGTSSEML